MSFKSILKSWKLWVWIIVLIIALISINYQFGAQGVIINSVDDNSSAFLAGMTGPSMDVRPTAREVIHSINEITITNKTEYFNVVDNLKNDTVIKIKTDKSEYSLLYTKEIPLGLTVADTPSSNIVKGLELQGGTRVLLSPEGEVTDADIKDVIDVLQNRLNVYGLTDLTVKAASDLEGKKYILVEIAGATQQEVKDLLAQQGKFEAKIGDQVVFSGGKQDITFVCRTDGTCSRISSCNPSESGETVCKFEFEIGLSEGAANRHAQITKDLAINYTSYGGAVLSKKIDFYLDEKLVDSLNVAADLKGQAATRILISGSGVGKDRASAIQNTIEAREKLQTLLITGSLPTQIKIVKLDSISPSLGGQFINNAWLVGLLALLAVGVVIFIRYRKIKIILPMMMSVASEVVIILGFAALFRYNLDLAAIAGIIASVGTGVDDLVVITDESLTPELNVGTSLTERIKSAFFIVLAAYAATVAAMIPLFTAGAGLLTGFAVVTIVGVTVGVFIVRPAYAAVVKELLK